MFKDKIEGYTEHQVYHNMGDIFLFYDKWYFVLRPTKVTFRNEFSNWILTARR